MKTLTTLLLVALLPALGLALRGDDAAAATRSALDGGRSDLSAAQGPAGSYLEARSATVWGGACHINAEIVTQERQALVSYAFDGGGHQGEALAGVRVVLALEGERPLSQVPAERGRAWTSGGDLGQQRAALAWCCVGLGMDPAVLETQHDAAVELDHGGLAVRVGGLVEVQGDPVPDDACCTMPESRWYLTLDGRVPETRVALGEVCAVRPEAASHGAHEPWSSTGSNNLQYGRFGARP